MPDQVVLSPAQTTALDLAARAGQSRVEASKDGPDTAPAPDFAQALQQAQAQSKVDQGKAAAAAAQTPAPPSAATPAPSAPPAGSAPAATPAPAQPDPLEWRPKRPDAAQQWDALKARHAQELAAVRSELDALKSQAGMSGSQSGAQPGSPPPELEAARNELTQLRETLKAVAIERDPEFNAKFKAKSDAAINAAKIAAGEHGETLAKLLASPSSAIRDERITALVEELPASSKRRIDAALQTLDQIDIEKSVEIASNRQSWEEKQLALATQSEQRTREQQAKFTQAFDAQLKRWTDPLEGHPFFQIKAGDDAHNSAVSKTVQLAREILTGNLDEKQLATAALWAASGARTWEALAGAREEIDKLKADNDKLRGVVPGAGQDGAASAATPSYDPNQPHLYDQSFVAQLTALQRAELAAKR